MSATSFRLTAVASAGLWLLLGMHAPLVHDFTRHGRVPSAGVLLAVALVLVAAPLAASMTRRTRPDEIDTSSAETGRRHAG